MNRKALIPVAVLLVAGGIALLTCRRNAPAARLRLSGNLEVVQVELSFRTAGRILERPVDEGHVLTPGQLVARLDATDLEQSFAMRQAEARTAQAALAEALAGSRPEEITAAQAALEQAQADLRRLEPDEARHRDLMQRGFLSVRDYEATRAALDAARAKVRQAEQAYVLAKKGPRAEDIAQAQARADQAAKALDLAATQLGYAVLTAPTAGLVLSKNLEPGEYAAPGNAVVTLGDLHQIWVRAYLEEGDLGRVKVGQKAVVRTDTYPDKPYEGRVSFIAAEAEFTPKSVQTRKERAKLVYRIKVDVPNPAMELKPGMPADVEIALDEAGR